MEPLVASVCDRESWSRRVDDVALVALAHVKGPSLPRLQLLQLPEHIVSAEEMSQSSSDIPVRIFGYPRRAKGKRVSTEGRLTRAEPENEGQCRKEEWQFRHTCETGGGFSGSVVLTNGSATEQVRIVAVHWNKGASTSIEHMCRKA